MPTETPFVVRTVKSALAIAGIALSCTALGQQSDVARGEYLARAGDCISCHTGTNGKPFAGGLRLDTPFGYMLSPNITPDPDTGIGKWSYADFDRAMRHGINRQGQDMFPVMPYDFYTKLTDADTAALYAYVRTVSPVRNVVVTNHLDFPFNQRWAMSVWRELYFTPGTYRPDPQQSAAWNRGAYLVEGLGHCSDCHSPRNVMGGIEKSKQFSGAVVDGWFALNLSSNLHTGLGDWTAQEIATYLKTGSFRGRTTSLGPMDEVIRNSMSYMTDADLLAIGTYLKSLPPSSTLRAGKPMPSQARLEVGNIYLDKCSGCHQASGRGIPGTFPPLAGNGVVLAPSPADIIKVVLGGVPPQGRYVPMPSFADQLTDQGVADIANYVRTSWGNSAAANATADMVRSLRK
jgi:mono/diheme cytochrome c family protein